MGKYRWRDEDSCKDPTWIVSDIEHVFASRKLKTGQPAKNVHEHTKKYRDYCYIGTCC